MNKKKLISLFFTFYSIFINKKISNNLLILLILPIKYAFCLLNNEIAFLQYMYFIDFYVHFIDFLYKILNIIML
jgi:hypothetical protein